MISANNIFHIWVLPLSGFLVLYCHHSAGVQNKSTMTTSSHMQNEILDTRAAWSRSNQNNKWRQHHLRHMWNWTLRYISIRTLRFTAFYGHAVIDSNFYMNAITFLWNLKYEISNNTRYVRAYKHFFEHRMCTSRIFIIQVFQFGNPRTGFVHFSTSV